MICFEFTPEFMDSAMKCVQHLSEIGPAEFNYCLESTPTSLALPEWCTPEQMREILGALTSKRKVGDVYVRFDN
jgi:hypothetical protein